nr:MAG TPA: hypothetical protein [Caudoviricetes sp.]
MLFPRVTHATKQSSIFKHHAILTHKVNRPIFYFKYL